MLEARGKRWQRRSDARPAELTAAAFALFAEQGFAATRLEDVAARAGVSKATIYRYFRNKDALFEAVVKSAFALRFSEVETLVKSFEGSSADLLRTLFNAARVTLDGPVPLLLKMVISESANFPQLPSLWADHVARNAMGLVRRIIARGIARREFRKVDLDAIVPVVVGPVIMVAIWQQTFARTGVNLMNRDRVLNQHVDVLLRGLARTRADP